MKQIMNPILPMLADLIRNRKTDITDWFETEYRSHGRLFYTSVDLRHAGFKIAPVDTNLFPAGFNNLSGKARERASAVAKSFLHRHCTLASKLLIVPEDHTRNLFYLENLRFLRDIIKEAGYDVRIAAPQGTETSILATASGHELPVLSVSRRGNRLIGEDGFNADYILINNDMTDGMPPWLEGLDQCIMPPLELGWYRRRKSEHFDRYREVANRFAMRFSFDPWLITPYFHHCGMVDFKAREGLECMALGVDKVIHRLRSKYMEYSIDTEPYVFVKADSGTYGMGIMTARSGEDILAMNKDERNKMHKIKEGTRSNQVIVQEGIPTVDRIEGHPAEPMIYLIAGQAVGGAFRVNTEKDERGNLNAKGMKFVGMCDDPATKERFYMKDCDFSVYALVSELASLAAAREQSVEMDVSLSAVI